MNKNTLKNINKKLCQIANTSTNNTSTDNTLVESLL